MRKANTAWQGTARQGTEQDKHNWTAEVVIAGTRPLLMNHRDIGNELALRGTKHQVRRDTPLTLADFKRDAEAALYVHEGSIVVPSDNVLSCLSEGGVLIGRNSIESRTNKRLILTQVNISPQFIKIHPQDWKVDIRQARVKGNRVIRSRPVFHDWKLSFQVSGNMVDEGFVQNSLITAGVYVGLCDFRPKFGTFEVKTWKRLK